MKKNNSIVITIICIIVILGSILYASSLFFLNKKYIEETNTFIRNNPDPEMLNVCIYIESIYKNFLASKNLNMVEDVDRDALVKCYFESRQIMNSKLNKKNTLVIESVLAYFISVTTYVELKYKDEKYYRF